MIPSFQKVLLPFLKILSDEKEHSKKDILETISVEFNLTEEEKNQIVPSGQFSVIQSRVGWARTYLKMAGLIIYVKRGVFKITERGKKVLQENLIELDIKYLKQFPEFLIFIEGNKKEEYSQEIKDLLEEVSKPSITPNELIEDAYRSIKRSLEWEVIETLKSVKPSFFEKIVVELLVKMGYGGSMQDAGKAIGKSGDEGIDGIIKEDKLGLDVIYIQAKRWQGVVGRPEVQKFVGALAGQRAKKGVFITTSYFTKEAIDYALQMDTKVVLIDGEKLAQYMIDYNLGVSIQNIYEIKKIDSDYFEED
jgi:restriction system protein